MKRLSLLLFLVYFSYTTVYTQGEWDVLNQGLDGFPEDADFVDKHGWIAGYFSLLKSDDNGINWYEIPLGEDLRINKVDFITPEIGLAYGFSTLLSSNVVAVTYNGGENWEIKYDLETSYAIDIYAQSEDTVFVMGGNFILKTTDSFATETTIFLETQMVELKSLDFFNKNVGVAVGGSYGDSSFGLFFKTDNGGTDWEEVKERQIRDIYNIKLAGEGTAFFSARDDSGKALFCKTDDFFETWEIKSKSADFGNYNFYPMSEDTVFSVTAFFGDTIRLTIEVSYNSGQDWLSIKELPFWGINTISFENGNGLITGTVGGGGFIGEPYGPLVLRSSDGGFNWDIQLFSYPFLDVQFLDDNKGFAVGGSNDIHHQTGEVFITNDGGKHWELNQFPGVEVSTIQFLDNNLGYYIADHRMFKTTNGGDSWFVVYQNNYDLTGISIALLDFEFVNTDTGWMVGRLYEDASYAVIMKTENGGTDWEIELQLEEMNFRDIFLLDEQNGWAVGDAGLIAKLDNGEWQKILPVSEKYLTKVYFSDPNNGWASSGFESIWYADTYLLRTTDGGEKWDEIENFNFIIEDIFFADNNIGWMVGADTSNTGVILYTDNGGDDWDVLVKDLSDPLHAITFNENYGWVVGDDGLVLRTDDGVSWIKDPPADVGNFKLFQNYPNPFNASTNIKYQLQTRLIASPLNTPQHVNLSIYNMLGQQVTTLVDKKQAAGNYTVQWDASNFSSGLYYYKLKTDNGFSQTKKLLLLK